MAWIKLTSVTVANGSKTVAVTGNHDLSSVKAGWSFDVGSNRAEINSGTAADGSGNSTLTLVDPWDGATVTSQPAKVVPLAGGLIDAISEVKALSAYAVQLQSMVEEYATVDGDINVTLPDSTVVNYPTLVKMQRLVQDMLNSTGTAATHDVTENPTDTTAGRVLQVGDFGLGQISSTAITDADALIATGFYTTSSSWTGSVFAGVDGNNQGYIEHKSWSSGNLYASQEFFNVNATWEKWTRRKDNGVWTAWVKDLHANNTGSIVTQDYEKGTWTPRIYGQSGGVITVQTIHSATWRRTADEMVLTAYLTGVSTVGVGLVGAIWFDGLPSVATPYSGGCIIRFCSFIAGGSDVTITGYLESTYVALTKGSSTAAVTAADIISGSGGTIMVEIRYKG